MKVFALLIISFFMDRPEKRKLFSGIFLCCEINPPDIYAIPRQYGQDPDKDHANGCHVQ